MDPITVIVSALVAGAAAAAKPTAERAVKDAYDGIRQLITRRFQKTSLAPIEANPSSQADQQVLKEDLSAAGAEEDGDLLAQAKVLLEALRAMPPDQAVGAGVNLDEVKGASLAIDDIIASRVGVNVRQSEFTGDIRISKVRAGVGEQDPL